MHYDWSKILAPEETVEKEFGISPFYLKCILIFSAALGLVSLVVAYVGGVIIFLLGLVYWYYLKKAKHYAFTKKRMIMVESFLGVNITSVDYTQITDVTVEQSLLDQVGKWGTLVVNTAGTNSPEMRISFIDEPKELKQTLDTIRDSVAIKVKGTSN